MDPDKLNQWLKTAGAPLVTLGALTGSVVAGIQFLRQPFEKISFIGPDWALALAIFLPVAAAAMLLWTSFRFVARKSRLLRPERFDLRVRDRGDLFGRDGDIDDLRDLVQQYSLIFVDGESGSGKSSLVRFGLVPALADEGDLLPVLVAQYRGDWDLGLAQQLHGLIWSGLSEAERVRLGIAERPALGSVKVASVERLLADIAAKLGRQPLLIFDQFDDYQLAHRARFLDEQRAWIPAARLAGANAFWKAIDAALGAEYIRVMVITRSDASAGLHSVRFTDLNTSRPVLRLSGTWLPRLLDQLTADDGKGAVIGDPESGWADLKRLIELDLDRGSGILPQQVRTMLLGLRELPGLTPAEYRRAGRASGAEAMYIRDSIRWSAQASGLNERQVRSLLLGLVERGPANSAKTRTRSDLELREIIADDAARQKALERLGRDEVVREFDEGGAAGPRWLLDHDYLAAAVIAEERLTNPQAVLLRDKADAWQRTAGMGLRERYRALLPIGTQFALAWARIRSWGRFTYQPYGRFAALSLLKIAPLALLLFGGIGWAAWVKSPTYQIRTILAEVPAKTNQYSNVDEWAGALALAGRADQAIALARSVHEPLVRAAALANIAQALGYIGDHERATVIAREAAAVHQAAEDMLGNPRTIFRLTNLASQIDEAGAPDGALAIVRWARPLGPHSPYPTVRGRLAITLAQQFRKLGKRDEALATLNEARPAIVSSGDLVAAAIEEFHRNGDDQQAAMLAALPVPIDEDDATSAVQWHLARANFHRLRGAADRQAAELEAAIDATKPKDGTIYYSFGSGVGQLLIRNATAETVLIVARNLQDPSSRAFLLTEAATEASRIGKPADAARLMRAVTRMARGRPEPLERAQMLVTAARAFHAQENKAERKAALIDALAAARTIDEDVNGERKLAVMADIANDLVEIETDQVARDALTEAAALVRRLTSDPSDYLPTLALAMASAGRIEEARSLAEQVRNGGAKLDAFSSVLRGYALYRDPSLRGRIDAAERARRTEDD